MSEVAVEPMDDVATPAQAFDVRGKLIPSGNGSVRHKMRNLCNAC